jgi:Mn-dependent DtxR family transcriptional regulator
LPYKGVTLTEAGQAVANNVIRRRRWEVFLVDRLELSLAARLAEGAPSAPSSQPPDPRTY